MDGQRPTDQFVAGPPAVGPAQTVPVVPIGIVQGVRLPKAGDYLVTFNYLPDTVGAGLVISLIAGAVLVLWAGIEFGVWRRRRRRRETDPAEVIPV